MLTARNIHKTYGLTTVLGGVTFALARGEKMAIVGSNGSGKSTLLRIIAGLEEPDRGVLERSHGIEIGYLPQQIEVQYPDETVEAYLERTIGLTEIKEKLRSLETDLENKESVEEYMRLDERFQNLRGYAFAHRAEALLEGFGLGTSPLQKSIKDLSGGQKTKVALTAVLLKGVDLLLLDEPTNNLDIPALEWLEYFVKNTPVACIVVSHDRRFLDATISKVGEIDWFERTLHMYGGTYTDFLEHKRKLLQQRKEEYRRQQEEIERLEDRARRKKAAASRGAHWGGTDKDKMLRGFKRDRAAKSSRTAKALEKRIEQMDTVVQPRERDEFVIDLEPTTNKAQHSLEVCSVVAGYPEGFSIGPFSLSIQHGSRVVIVGANGSGKTTILKTIIGNLHPRSGTVRLGSSLVVGSLTQGQEEIPLDITPAEFLRKFGGVDESGVFHLLDRFGFEEHESRKKLRDFSVGGRVRLVLATFAARKVNVLVLDEPTNHLDVEGMDALETVLRNYTGTIIMTSHDRHLLDVVQPTHVYLIENEELREGSLELFSLPSIQARMERLIRRFQS